MAKTIELPVMDRPTVEMPKIQGINMDSLHYKHGVEAFNNDVSTFEAVMGVFMDVCRYDRDTAFAYTQKIHKGKSCVCYWNSLENCERVVAAFAKIGVDAKIVEV